MRRMILVVALVSIAGLITWRMFERRADPEAAADDRFAPIRLTPDAAGPLDCERLSYPCTWAEVAPAVFTRSVEIGDEALDRLGRDGLDAAHRWLSGVPGMAEVLAGTHVLYFRLEGGRPVWVRSILPAVESARAPAISDAVPARYVVGEDRNSDEKVNQRDGRRVLILDPLTSGHPLVPSELNAPVAGPQVAELFRRSPAYRNGIDLRMNEAANVDAFARWDEYDVVHAAAESNLAHADEGPGRRFALTTGEWIPLDQAVRERDIWGRRGIELMSCCAGLERPERGILLLVSLDFFRDVYPAGLDRTIVFLDNSRTLYLPLARALVAAGSRSSTLFAWQGDRRAAEGAAARAAVYQLMMGEGLSALQTNLRLADRIQTTGNTPLASAAGGILRHVLDRDNARAREIVTLLREDGAPLLEDTELEGLVDGALGDGKEDFLSVTARIEGMVDPEVGALVGGVRVIDLQARMNSLSDDALHTQIWLEFDGRPITDPRGIFQEPRDGDVVTVRFDRVPLGQDLRRDRRYELEAVVELPRENGEDGESRYSVMLGRGYYVDVQYGGQVTGSYAGETDPPAILRVFTSDETPRGQCAIALEIESDAGDYGVLGGLLPAPIRAGTYLVRDSRPQANATVLPDSVGLQVRPACALIEPECERGWRTANSIGGRFQLDRVAATSAAGSFAIDVEGGGITRRYVVSGRFYVPLRNLAGGQLPPTHPCRPR